MADIITAKIPKYKNECNA